MVRSGSQAWAAARLVRLPVVALPSAMILPGLTVLGRTQDGNKCNNLELLLSTDLKLQV